MGSSTNNRSLYKPSDGEEGWATNVNANFDELDSLPEYDDVSNAPADDGFIIYVTGDGATTPEGLYQRQSGSYVHIDPSGGGIDLENTDGTALVADATAIQADAFVSFSDDTDGTGTLDVTGDTNALDGSAGTDGQVWTSTGSSAQWEDASGGGSVDLSDGHGLTDPGAGHSTFSDGLSDAEIDRFSLATGETLEVYRLAAPLQGGGTEAGFTVEVYDETADTVLASVTGGGLTTFSSPGAGETSGDGNEVVIRVSNSSGSVVDASVQHRLNITDGSGDDDLSDGHGLTGPGAGHSTFSDGLSDAEIDRFSLASGEVLEVYRLAAPLEGGGTEANFSVEVYDETAATVLASVTGGGLTTFSSPGSSETSGDGNEVIVRVSNSSGSVVDASVQHRLNITDA